MNMMNRMNAAFSAIDEMDNDSRTILGLYGMSANGTRTEAPTWSSLSRRRDRQRKRT